MLRRSDLATVTAAAVVGAVGWVISPFDARGAETPPSAEPGTAASAGSGAIEAKLRLLDAMLGPAGAASRIEKSDVAAARERLDHARGLRAQAGTAVVEGRAKEAEAQVNEALKEVGAALKLVGNPEEARAAARRRAAELHDRVAGFREAYRRVVAEKSRSRGGTIDETGLDAALDQAAKLVREDRDSEAIALLSPWADRLETELTRLREKQTLVHELRFDTPEAEYAYERGRNHSFELLIGIALKDTALNPRVRDSAEQAVRDNRSAREQADETARGGATGDALKALEASTGALIKVLRATGMPIP